MNANPRRASALRPSVFLAVSFLLSSGPFAPATLAQSSSDPSPAQAAFNEVNELLQGEYGGLSKVDRTALTREYQAKLDAACEAVSAPCPVDKAYPVLEAEVNALGDEHSFFQTPEDFQDFMASATGGNRRQFGVKLARLDGENRVVLEVVPQSSAEEAGLQRGDLLVRLDDKPYTYDALRAARLDGRSITLSVERQGQPLTLTLASRESSTRDLPRLSFTGAANNVAVLRIPTFLAGGGVAQRVHDLVGEARRRGTQGLIVDLRGNTGGSLSECDSSVSAFVPTFTRMARGPEGNSRTLVSRGARMEDGHNAGGVRNPQLWTGPVDVLVDEGSASCSEFFAYEIQYAGRGPIIGQATAGVGNTATRVFPVGEDAALQLTILNYAKPDGQPYPVRVTPDRLRAQTEDDIRALTRGQDPLLALGVEALTTAPTIAQDRVRP
ncbi:S41 family peptidase [Deinococcus hopiensis]|uniref:Carboxyl-terminal processing protease n=1 Tax=Deinococcus hopiensis KR-140 TaxID=695939 RepID=A0A1W1V7X1_9DEIO|nr:S41 family peptidase [Deinococcus hopiensis]SMB89519.1 carboxyl-terminal processing protease [Deinococcus hopiensis KR-140]